MIESLILCFGKKQYTVSFKDYQRVVSSDIPALHNKTPSDVWRWARMHRARVYHSAFLPSS